jgi:peptidoglycan hydrolase-like protein with peptidoglycan-binding domain
MMAMAVLPLTVIATDAVTAKKKKTTSTPASTTARRTTSATRKRTTSSAKRTTSWHPRQLQPTPERYKEIQSALASKGYLKGEPNGLWGQESVDAMQRFQKDQNLNASGKIDSLSLIALGLGPKRGTSAEPPSPIEPKQATDPQAPADRN